MVRGFYMLTSGMLTQNRILDTISNNVANMKTNGFKAKHLASKTFGEMMLERVDSGHTPIGSTTLMATTADKPDTDFSEGAISPTDRGLDFAISGDGFFAVQGNGGTYYTRNGSFNLDAGGYLALNGAGRVLGKNGQPIHLGTDDISCDKQGNIYAGNNLAGSIGVYRFPNNAALDTVGEGFYQGQNAQAEQTPQIVWRAVESSNADMSVELTRGITSQRSLQSCAQALKMYDQILDKATTDIGKV